MLGEVLALHKSLFWRDAGRPGFAQGDFLITKRPFGDFCLNCSRINLANPSRDVSLRLSSCRFLFGSIRSSSRLRRSTEAHQARESRARGQLGW